MSFNDQQEAPIHAAKKLIRIVCEQNPVRFSLPKLLKVEDQINLSDFSWALAMCESRYETFGAVDQDTEFLYNKLKVSADFYLELLREKNLNLPLKIADEITPIYTSKSSKMLFKLAPRRLAKLLKSIPEIKHIIDADKKTQKKPSRSYRKDIFSMAILKEILPKIPRKKLSEFTVDDCWEQLPAALAQIGCTNLKCELKGQKDNQTIVATHKNLPSPATNYKAFRKRYYSLLKVFLSQ